ncbi:CoA transferase [Georgenia sp. AZ-5]|uniref:CoA transferase n=1 Tax=Georgenia sp. AZ-5 TaxID=3367526 RepID=UPI0037551025
MTADLDVTTAGAGAPWPELPVPWGHAAEADDVAVGGPRRRWGGPLDVEGLAVAGVRETARAARALGSARGAAPVLAVDSRDVTAAFDSLGHLRVDGRALQPWAPLSAFFPAAEGWVRLHANYPHHRRALLRALTVAASGADDDAARSGVAAAVAALPAHAVETRVRAAGGIAAALRTPGEWRGHEQGRVVAAQPLVELGTRVGDAGPTSGRAGARSLPPTLGLPMAGLRVLDLTRVIAGPTATRVLGALGADVLRIDPPGNPELPDAHLDTGFAKRSALADLAEPAARRRLEALLTAADAVVTGYRPGALAVHGFDALSLLGRHPHLVVAELSAWGHAGTWGRERGFDSIVQVATGIADVCGAPAGGRRGEGWRPGALPVQALDHTAGYLLAAAVMRLLARRGEEGGGHARLSLAGVARELLALPGSHARAETDDARRAGDGHPGAGPAGVADVPTRRRGSFYGELEYVPAPLRLDGDALDYPSPPDRYGTAALSWR